MWFTATAGWGLLLKIKAVGEWVNVQQMKA
jgi:hypothetical protein